jgi:hypothetical protein
MERAKGIYLLYFALFISAFQALKGGDFLPYIFHIRDLRATGWAIPYPVTQGLYGYFQSPLTTVLLFPISFLPDLLIRILWNLLLFSGIIFIFKTYLGDQVHFKRALFLVLLFAHALSDVFMAQNLIVLTLILLVAADRLIQSRSIWLAGLCLALATFIRPFSALLLPWYLFHPDTRRVGISFSVFILLGFGLTFAFFGFDTGVLWWRRWLQALPLYSQAADPTGTEFQSLTAAVYRWSNQLIPGWRSPMVSLVSVVYFAFCYALAFRKKLSVPILLTTLYVCFPVSWIAGMLFVFPYIAKVSEKKISWVMWVGAISYALLPKWLWPRDLWIGLSHYGVAATAFFIVLMGAFCVELSTESERAHYSDTALSH